MARARRAALRMEGRRKRLTILWTATIIFSARMHISSNPPQLANFRNIRVQKAQTFVSNQILARTPVTH